MEASIIVPPTFYIKNISSYSRLAHVSSYIIVLIIKVVSVTLGACPSSAVGIGGARDGISVNTLLVYIIENFA